MAFQMIRVNLEGYSTIHGDGNQTRDFICMTNVVDLYYVVEFQYYVTKRSTEF